MPFKKGVSGNKNGRPRGTKSQKTIIRERKLRALEVLESAMQDSSLSPETRVKAASTLIFMGQSVA